MSNLYKKERRRLNRVLREIKKIEATLKTDIKTLRRDVKRSSIVQKK